MSSKSSFISSLGLLTAFLVVPLPAQDKPAEEKPATGKNEVRISLLAVGDLPPIEYLDTDKGPVWVEPQKEDFPPPILYVKASSKGGGFAQLQLGLNTPMPPIKHPGGNVMRIFEDKDAALAGQQDPAAKESYLNVPLPDAKVDLTVFLVRNPDSKSWRTPPKSYAFKSDLVTFPPDCVRLINFTSHPVRAKISDAVVSLGPAGGDSSVKIVKAASKDHVISYQIGAVIKGEPVMLANTATSFYDGTRLNMAVYMGDGKGAAGHPRFCKFQEPAPQKEPAVKTATNAGPTAPSVAAEP